MSDYCQSPSIGESSGSCATPSAANAEAIAAARAQAEAQERLFRRALELGGQLGATAARAYGIPIPAAGIAPSNSPAVPEGWKLVPKDDPSKPQLELTHE